MAVHQLVHTLSYGDAISGEVLAMRRALHALGIESEIFALNAHCHYKDITKGIDEFVAADGDTIVLHYSLGSPLNDLYRSSTNLRRVMIYHNITPAKWYASINPRVHRNISTGLSELPSIAKASDLILADSEFNREELLELGFQSEVLELPLDPKRWDIESNEGVASILKADGCKNILHVGRLAPNKSIEDILKIFYFYHHNVEPNSKLWLVGTDTDTELYSFVLKKLQHELRLHDKVAFAGIALDEEVKSFYENAHFYLCMSEHEGFCLPIIEALHFGVPVIAYDAGAVPRTLGGAGILVKEKRHNEIAELMGILGSDQTFRAKSKELGQAHVKKFSFETFQDRVKTLLVDWESNTTLKKAHGS